MLIRTKSVLSDTFDKTGTLTTGKLQVVHAVATQKSTDQLFRIAAALESLSEHPIGAAIVQAARQQNLTWAAAINGQAQAGQGITGEIDRQMAVVGKATFVQAQTRRVSNDLVEQSQQWESDGKTVVWVAYGGEFLVMIAVANTVRPAAAQAISRLKRLGVERIVMLTGDNSRTAHSIAEQIGVDHVYAELLAWSHLWWVFSYPLAGWLGSHQKETPFLYGGLIGLVLLVIVQTTLSPKGQKHAHENLWHEHEHVHDESHRHKQHPGIPESEPHLHPHQHPAIRHVHPYSDSHHFYGHG